MSAISSMPSPANDFINVMFTVAMSSPALAESEPPALSTALAMSWEERFAVPSRSRVAVMLARPAFSGAW